MITKTEYEFLNEKKMNEMITNAYISGFFRNITRNDYNKALTIVKNNVKNDHTVYKMSCSVCIMNLLKKAYVLWKEYKAEGDIQDWVIEKAINNIDKDSFEDKEIIKIEIDRVEDNLIEFEFDKEDNNKVIVKPKPIIKPKVKVGKAINKNISKGKKK